MRYCRNFVYSDINTLKACPWMPYFDPLRPYVQKWFASSEGDRAQSFLKTIGDRNQDRLVEEGGACIMYTHFGHGYVQDGRLNPAFRRAMPVWLKKKLHADKTLRRAFGGAYAKRFVYAEHHLSHAASAFLPSPFEEAAVLTLDGVGEWATASVGKGEGRRVTLLEELRFPHSLGLLYSAFTVLCGFEVNDGEYKLMGLAPYGEPRFADLILKRLIDLKADGSFRLDARWFGYARGLAMTTPRLHRLLGRAPRK